MGFREAVLLGLLVIGGNFCSATQSRFNFTTDETQIPQEPTTTSSQQLRSTQTSDPSNQMEEEDLVLSPVTYQLRSYQLRNPAVRTFQNQLVPLKLNPEEKVEARKKAKVQGPDLNPPVKMKSKVVGKFEQHVPVPADSVSVHCGEGKVTVQVKMNFLGNRQLIRPSDLKLGECSAAHADGRILQFESEPQGCGSTPTMTAEVLVYAFSLVYSPTPISSTFILKTNPAEVVIQCQYQRRHYVSSAAMRPTWKPLASVVQAEQRLHFSLRLMEEDWQSQRPSSVYFLSDVMHVEASVLLGHHVPLRVYVDSCVATVDPDPNSQPSYAFITNHGCLTDAKLTGAKSYFMQRSREDKLHLQLKAFRFHQDDRNSIYITCHLKATTVSVPVDSQHKACSFLNEAKRWVASGGDNEVCSCCETSCSEQRWRRSLAADAALEWEETVALGPILLMENILEEELTELPPVPLIQTDGLAQTALHLSMAVLCGVGAALAVLYLVFTGAIMCSRFHKATRYSVST
ncbi:zona pellucida sperm-binding protein 3-like isoform X2 [Mugil cephalus]|uniref:zona pellucida sperm-binding protein 3-like isoform X2 n=1 Tax=Mugil cephalus TaxID=48193 RepID=UPI001FB695AE|nr:zona pellucida sperm-binding protein 3-like isoform X2 [Mugil cephalus]